MTRDLVGYGPHPEPIKWPDDARVAVSVVVNYEEGSEYSLLDGDKRHEQLPETTKWFLQLAVGALIIGAFAIIFLVAHAVF